MLKFFMFLLPMILSANVSSTERNYEWVLAAERALDSPDYCQELSRLVEAPEANQEILPVLQEILKTKCKEIK